MKPYTIKSCLDDYMIEDARPNGVGLRRVLIAQGHLQKFLGEDREVVSLKRRDIRDYRAHRLAAGVVDSTVRRELGVLSKACAHAVNEERIDVMPVIPLPPDGEPRERWFTEDEVQRILSEPMSDVCRVYIYLALFTGARLGACCDLQVGRVDFVNGYIDFRVPGARVTKKRRVKTKMNDYLRTILKPRLDGMKPSDYVLGGATPDQIGPQVAKVFERAGVKAPGVRCHVFRRTFVNWAFLGGAKPAEVSAATGDTIATLEKSYFKVFPQHTAGAVDAIKIAHN
jgi:integrase